LSLALHPLPRPFWPVGSICDIPYSPLTHRSPGSSIQGRMGLESATFLGFLPLSLVTNPRKYFSLQRNLNGAQYFPSTSQLTSSLYTPTQLFLILTPTEPARVPPATQVGGGDQILPEAALLTSDAGVPHGSSLFGVAADSGV